MGPVFLGTSAENLHGDENPGRDPFSRNLLEGCARECTSGSLPHLLEVPPPSLSLREVQTDQGPLPPPSPSWSQPGPGRNDGGGTRKGDGGVYMLRAPVPVPQVRYLKIIEKSGYQALPWVRYITQNGGACGPPVGQVGGC